MTRQPDAAVPLRDLPEGTVTFLFSDIEGSTQLLIRLGDRFAAVVGEHHRILRDTIARNHGHVVRTEGDSFFVAFPRATDAVEAAVEAQRGLAQFPWPEGAAIRVRMGLHTGEAEVALDDYVGIAVHRAARIAGVGHGGQVLLSETTAALACDELPPGVSLLDLGRHLLKDLRRPERIWQVCIEGLPEAFPPLRTPGARSPGLPFQPTSFIGRRLELAELRQTLMRPDVRLVTLTGPGGAGKTRLALQVAQELLAAFQDGVFFVALAAIHDSLLVLPTIAQTLGLREAPDRPIAQQLADHLRLYRVLLVLDNMEQVVEAAPALAGLLAATAELKVLVTSRALLHIYGEHDYPVPPLPSPDLRSLPSLERLSECESVQLFVQRAQAARPGFALDASTAPAVADICAGVDGLPLAIELAAARVRVLPLSKIRAGLHNRLDLLAAGPRDRPTRQQSLRATIDWSHDLLDAEQKKLFRRLAVFVGGFSLEAAGAVCGLAPGHAPAEPAAWAEDGLRMLEMLVDQSLVTVSQLHGEPRFSMLETIREYAAERLESEASQEALEVRRRHAAYFLSLYNEGEQCALANVETKSWLDRLDAEHDNLRAGLEWCLDSSQADLPDRQTGMWLAAAAAYFWLYRPRLNEARRWLARALDCTPQPGAALAKVLTRAGMFAWQQGDYAQAEIQLQEGTKLWRELGDSGGLAEAAHMLGHLRLDQRLHGEARELFQESLDLYRGLGNTPQVLVLTDDLAFLAYHQGEFAAARACFEASLNIYRKQENREGIAQALNRLGELARLRADHDVAEALFAESLALCRELGLPLEAASVVKNLGHVALVRGQLDRARALFCEGLTVETEQGNKQGIAECLAGLAALARPPERAALLFAATGALLDAVGAPLSPADRSDWERNLAAVRAQSDAAAFAAAWAEGLAMAGCGTDDAWNRVSALALAPR